MNFLELSRSIKEKGFRQIPKLPIGSTSEALFDESLYKLTWSLHKTFLIMYLLFRFSK